jgi:hypothetical protein
MADREFTASKDVDLTPATATNWAHRCPTKVPVLMVNPDATLHDRVSLAWALTGELCAIAEGSNSLEHDDVPRFVVGLMSDRLEALHRLLSDIGNRTADLSQPAAA